jgi:hypothetical protein
MKVLRFRFYVVVFVFCVFTRQGVADDVGRGGYAGSFLRMGLGARALGMGGAFVACVDDGYTAYYNPAGLVFLDRRWLTTTLNSMALDRRLYYLGYAQSVGGKRGLIKGGFSVGWLCAGVDNIDARDFSGNDLGTLSSWEHCFFFSFALNPAPPFSVGFSVKLLYHRFPGITDEGGALSAVGLGFDFGIIVRPVGFLDLGLIVRDLRSQYTWDSQDLYERGTQTVNRFPQVVEAGLTARAFSNRAIFGFHLQQVEYCPLSYGMGMQIEGVKGVFLRCGLRSGVLAFGCGYRMEMGSRLIQMDYGFVPDPVAPRGNHVFTWSYAF